MEKHNMNYRVNPHRIVDLPPSRRDTANFLDLYWWKHVMYGLLEVDVTLAHQTLEAYERRTGESLSFTGYLVYCLACALDEEKSLQAYLKGRKKMVIFEDVDVGMTVERKMDGKEGVMGFILRGANHKSFYEIHQEIRAVQSRPVPPNKGMPRWFRSFLTLPWPIPPFFKAVMRAATRWDPTRQVNLGGTVCVTAVGMFGKGEGGWGLVPLPYSLGLIVGSTAWKPAVVDRQIVPREILNLTVVFDHDVVDGAPAARFGRRLVELIECGHGLNGPPFIAADQKVALAQYAVMMG